ncbi:hypothetical protein HYW76_03435 [Candidatus Pacearchaeota archaeon]|nr:hypothetical protein [Candidatus Pacearchaeota archaeon]
MQKLKYIIVLRDGETDHLGKLNEESVARIERSSERIKTLVDGEPATFFFDYGNSVSRQTLESLALSLNIKGRQTNIPCLSDNKGFEEPVKVELDKVDHGGVIIIGKMDVAETLPPYILRTLEVTDYRIGIPTNPGEGHYIDVRSKRCVKL